jgi:translation initiation factor IF-2
MWQIENPTYNPNSLAKGFILEAEVDSRKGIMVSVLVNDGILRAGDNIVTPTASGKIRVLENFLGQKVEELLPSSPALVIGFESLPSIGQLFTAGKLELEKLPQIEPQVRQKNAVLTKEDQSKTNIILKADVSGSLEALSHIILALDINGKKFAIVSEGVGEITDSDIKLASTTNSIVVGFNIKVLKSADNLARGQNVKVVSSDIIYRIVETLEAAIQSEGEGEKGPSMEVLAIFSQKNKVQLIGGKIISGAFIPNQKINIKRGEEVLGFGRITSLQQNKLAVKKVSEGEFGMMIESPTTVQVGDILSIEYSK